ncbi:MAG: DUF3866 family protein [Acidimicrobiales bacterium]
MLVERPGLQRVETDAGRAYVLTQLTGPVEVGDRVVLNTTAVGLGLGTGGWHVVHWNLSREEWSEPGPGHIMKLRYTSLQVDTGAAEEEHPDLPADIDGMPVVVCGLHSQVPAVAVAILAAVPTARLAYVMTDGAALPIALSDLVVDMVDAGLIAATITAGHAFGGDLEAVSVPSALALSRHVLAADVTVVAMGPGVVGTATELGTSSVEVASVLDSAAAMGGRPIAALRMSSGDERERHQGVSHHSRTALDLTRSPVLVAVPADVFHHDRHVVRVMAPPPMRELLQDAGLQVTTMGRSPEQDPLFFAAAGSAGALAAALL